MAAELGEHSPVFAAFARSAPDGPHDRPVAFVWFAASARTSFELYGGMDDEGQRLRANYGLKWHAITAMRERGVVRYDVDGLLNDGIQDLVGRLRELDLAKPPGPAEAIDWTRALALLGIGTVDAESADQTLGWAVKGHDDLAIARRALPGLLG